MFNLNDQQITIYIDVIEREDKGFRYHLYANTVVGNESYEASFLLEDSEFDTDLGMVNFEVLKTIEQRLTQKLNEGEKVYE